MSEFTVEELRACALAAAQREDGLAQDDLAKARAAFRGMTDEQMVQEYGQSGESRQQVLDSYERRARLTEATREWLREAARLRSSSVA